MVKLCKKCGEVKVTTEFSKWRLGKDGLRDWCKACDAEYHRVNREKHLKRFKAYYKLGRKMGVISVTILLISGSAKTAEPMGRDEAILELVKPKAKYKPYIPYGSKRLKAFRDPVYRSELVEAFEAAANEFDLPANLLIAMSYRETVYRPDLEGPAGERGIMQVGSRAIKRCSKYCGDLETIQGGALCGACWLDRGRKACGGDIVGALFSYVSGGCSSQNKNAIYAVQNRLWLWNYLNELTGETGRKVAL